MPDIRMRVHRGRRAENALKRWQPKAGDSVKVLPYHKAVSAEQQRQNLLVRPALSQRSWKSLLPNAKFIPIGTSASCQHLKDPVGHQMLPRCLSRKMCASEMQWYPPPMGPRLERLGKRDNAQSHGSCICNLLVLPLQEESCAHETMHLMEVSLACGQQSSRTPMQKTWKNQNSAIHHDWTVEGFLPSPLPVSSVKCDCIASIGPADLQV